MPSLDERFILRRRPGKSNRRAGADTLDWGLFVHRKAKPGLRAVLDYRDFAEIKAILDPIPIYLIGGLGLADFDLIDDLGVAGLAVCSALSAEGHLE